MADRDDEVGVGHRRWNCLLQLTTLLSEGKEDVVASPVVEIENNASFLAALDRGFLKPSPRNHNNFLAKGKVDHQEKMVNVIFEKPPIIGTPETSSGGECDQSPKSTLFRNPNSEKPRIDHQEKKRRLVNFGVGLSPNSTLFKNPNFKNINPPAAAGSNNKKRKFEEISHNFKKSAFPDSKKKKKSAFRCLELGENSSAPFLKISKQRSFMDWHIIINLLPGAAIRSWIVRTGGCLDGAVCVIEKDLFPNDVDTLSVPHRQVRERFLFPDEVELLLAHSDGGIRTTLIQPCLVECEITFGLWGSNTAYKIKNGWNDVCKKNGLRDGMRIRLWAFRRNWHLCFALELAN